jgi:hypothetical protein
VGERRKGASGERGAMGRNVLLAAPFLLAVPLAFGTIVDQAGHRLQPEAFLAGVAGWLVALILRAPVAAIAAGPGRGGGSPRLTGERSEPVGPGRPGAIVVAASGPLEEAVRLVVVLQLGRSLGTALWVGVGWGAVEALYAIVNGIALAALAEKSDPEAERVRRLLPSAAFSPTAPFWGIAERVWASAVHLGFTLVVAAVPPMVVATAAVHSSLNLVFLELYRRLPLWAVSLLGILVGGAVLGVGLALW